jgi:formate hydrogenlyase subunit 4
VNPAVLTIVQTVVVLALAPLAAGLVRRCKAFLQGRRGAPVLLPYWTVLTLMRKEIVLSSSTSWVFRAAPFAVLSTAIVSVAALPLVGRGGAAAPLSHLVIIAGIWMLGAVFLVFAGVDSSSLRSSSRLPRSRSPPGPPRSTACCQSPAPD